MAVNPIPLPGHSIRTLEAHSPMQQLALGFGHTLREILQQPVCWAQTAEHVAEVFETHGLGEFIAGVGHIVLTGSGSSHYIGESLAIGLQATLQIPVQAVPAGTLLTHWRGVLPRNALLVSFARSGDSPESYGVVDTLLTAAPDCKHLVMTCNASGRLAVRCRDESNARIVVLDERTNDRSLVMTSSFTNLVLAGRAIAMQGRMTTYIERAHQAAELCRSLLKTHTDTLAQVATYDVPNIAYLGSGVRYGSAREAALKMLEMCSGEVQTFAETFLGLRHGPMSSLSRDSLLVAFISSDPSVRAYELDLLRELARKELGAHRVLIGDSLSNEFLGSDCIMIDVPGLGRLGDDDAPLLDAVAGQLLAFFRCLHLGHKPDSPSEGVLTRVVDNFDLHQDPAG